MTPITLEWIEKAEGDWKFALRAYRARKEPNYDLACFLVQQCLEKYLKARLCEAGLPIQKTHNLVDLVDDVQAVEPSWIVMKPILKPLNRYAVLYRYPGFSATKTETANVIKKCRKLRITFRTAFGLPI